MSKFREWSVGQKLMTKSVVCFLLTIGLCGIETPFMGYGTPAQEFLQNAGFVTLFLFVALFVIGLLVLPVEVMRK